MILFWAIVIILCVFFGLVVFRGAPYVPSKKTYINQAFSDLYPLTDKDVLVDVGSGDGVVLRSATKFGALAIGYEINPILVIISRFLSRKNNRVKVKLVDFWLTRLPDDVTVVYAFSVKRDMKKMIKWIQNETNRLGKPIYLISFGFRSDDLKAQKSVGAYHLYKFHSLQSSKAQV